MREALALFPGITFASVHDSFWTHASTTASMSRIIREKFIDLHENRGPDGQPKYILEELDEALRARWGTLANTTHCVALRFSSCTRLMSRYPDKAQTLPELPEIGKLDLNEVKKSHYFFD
jgi:DNA-directed RNA polymerase